jgi:tetratricopeptide (TPR) repeat protein
MADMDINSKLRNFMGSALEELLAGNYEAALRDLKAAEVVDHHNPAILYNLGVSYCRLGLYRTACGYFDRLLELPGSFIEGQGVRKLCAYCRVRMGDYKKAEELIDQIISLSPPMSGSQHEGLLPGENRQHRGSHQGLQRVLELKG